MRPSLIQDHELTGLKLPDRILIHDWERASLKKAQSIENKKEFAMEILRLRSQALSIVEALRNKSLYRSSLISEEELKGLSPLSRTTIRKQEKILLALACRYIKDERQYALHIMKYRMQILVFAQHLKDRGVNFNNG